jgi:hypothetical protein
MEGHFGYLSSPLEGEERDGGRLVLIRFTFDNTAEFQHISLGREQLCAVDAPSSAPQRLYFFNNAFGGDMIRPWLVILIVLFAVAVHSKSRATETGTMICSGGVVSIGDTAGAVVAKCGQPATSTVRVEKRLGRESGKEHGRTVSEVSINDWIFNFGPNNFQYQLILENGRVTSIRSLDYGY